MEATAFLAAVSAFAVFLLVIFAYVNKKWRLLNVGTGAVQKEVSGQQQQAAKAQYRSHLGKRLNFQNCWVCLQNIDPLYEYTSEMVTI